MFSLNSKKTTLIVEDNDKLVFILLGLGNANSYLSYELTQISSLSNKKTDIVFVDNSIVSKRDLEYEKFISSDVGYNKAEITQRRCSAAFNTDIEVVNPTATTFNLIIEILKKRRDYFPVFICDDDKKILDVIKEVSESLMNCVTLSAQLEKFSGSVSFSYKKNGVIKTKSILTKNDSDIEIDRPNKSVCLEAAKNIFLYLDDMLCDRAISTELTIFNTKKKEIISKYINGDLIESNFNHKTNLHIIPEVGDKILFLVIGVGGTGATLAYELSHKIQSLNKDIKLLFIDGDIVEAKNLNRQRFISSDINEYKATTTARRCSRAYNIEIDVLDGYITSKEHIHEILKNYTDYFPIFIGCSDSLKLRYIICEAVKDIGLVENLNDSCIYIDAGNDVDAGQVVFTYKKEGTYITPDFFTIFSNDVEDAKNSKLVTEMSCDELMVSAPQTKGANISAATSVYLYIEDILEKAPISTYLTQFNNRSKRMLSK